MSSIAGNQFHQRLMLEDTVSLSRGRLADDSQIHHVLQGFVDSRSCQSGFRDQKIRCEDRGLENDINDSVN